MMLGKTASGLEEQGHARSGLLSAEVRRRLPGTRRAWAGAAARAWQGGASGGGAVGAGRRGRGTRSGASCRSTRAGGMREGAASHVKRYHVGVCTSAAKMLCAHEAMHWMRLVVWL